MCVPCPMFVIHLCLLLHIWLIMSDPEQQLVRGGETVLPGRFYLVKLKDADPEVDPSSPDVLWAWAKQGDDGFAFLHLKNFTRSIWMGFRGPKTDNPTKSVLCQMFLTHMNYLNQGTDEVVIYDESDHLTFLQLLEFALSEKKIPEDETLEFIAKTKKEIEILQFQRTPKGSVRKSLFVKHDKRKREDKELGDKTNTPVQNKSHTMKITPREISFSLENDDGRSDSNEGNVSGSKVHESSTVTSEGMAAAGCGDMLVVVSESNVSEVSEFKSHDCYICLSTFP